MFVYGANTEQAKREIFRPTEGIQSGGRPDGMHDERTQLRSLPDMFPRGQGTYTLDYVDPNA
jgi:hypothetical protein